MLSNHTHATFIGSFAILLWSSLALFTTQASGIPPLLLLTLTFGVATLLFFIVYLFKGELRRSWKKTPLSAMAMGGLGFYFYHFCYFYAFQHAPPVEAGLIAYLWPLLIVLLAGLTGGNRLLWTHLVGALIAFAGTGIMLESRGHHTQVEGSFLGYAAAFACAFIWSSYSVANRRFAAVPSSSVLWYCLITTVLAGLSHLLLEPKMTGFSTMTWIAILGLGFGPVGIAFFCWDVGVKRGNLSLLGVLSYTAPALSTAWLGLFTDEKLSQAQIIACVFITAGALFASLMPTKQRPSSVLPTENT